MPGIRIEGQMTPPPGALPPGAIPPGRQAAGRAGIEQQLGASGVDPFAGLSVTQLQALNAGGMPWSEPIRAAMDAHRVAAANATTAAIGRQVPGAGRSTYGPEPYAAWNMQSRASYADARWMYNNQAAIDRATQAQIDANRGRQVRGAGYGAYGPNPYSAWNAQSRGDYANARWMYSNQGAINQSVRQEASYENKDRDLAQARLRREAEYENTDRELEKKRMARLALEIRQEAEYENRDRDLGDKRSRHFYDQQRQEAAYENRDRDLSYAQMRRTADAENADFDRSAAYRAGARWGGGGGGDGGGRGGGGSGGRGTGRGGGLPFANMFGLANTSKLATAGLEIGIAGAIIEELAFLPQHVTALAGKMAGSAKPYWDIQNATEGIGRVGRFPGQSMLGQVWQGAKPPDWMAQLGLQPQEAVNLLSNYGIFQTGAEAAGDEMGGRSQGGAKQNQEVIRRLAEMKFIPALSAMPEGVLEQSAGAAASYGVIRNRAAGIQDYSAQMVDVFARATELGLNRAAVLHSIDTSIATAARAGGGIGATPQAVGDALLRYANVPGGRTGELGQSMIAASQNYADQVGSSPVPTIAYASLAQRLDSEGAVKSYFESKDKGFYGRVKENPASAELLKQYLAARGSGNMVAASMLLADLVKESPGITLDVPQEEGVVGSFPAGTPMGTLTRAGSQGVRSLDIIAGEIGKRSEGTSADRAQRVREAHDYFKNQGWSENAIGGILGYIGEETGGKFNPTALNLKGGGEGARGIGQWRGKRINDFRALFHHDPLQGTFEEQLQFMQWELTHTERDRTADLETAGSPEFGAELMVRNFGRPGKDTENAVATAREYAGAYAQRTTLTPQVSEGQAASLAARAQAGGITLQGAALSSAEVNVLIPKLGTAIQLAIDGLEKAKHALETITPESGQAMMDTIN